MTEAQLLDFTHQYLQEMGYAEPGQPWLIYAHHDTDNTHLHVVTSRIAPDGRKIPHAHERRRSQEVIDKLLSMDRKKKTAADIDASQTNILFASFAQFKAVLTSMGYEAYQKTARCLSNGEERYRNEYRWRKLNRSTRTVTGNGHAASNCVASSKNTGT